jgi:hypothetical protein
LKPKAEHTTTASLRLRWPCIFTKENGLLLALATSVTSEPSDSALRKREYNKLYRAANKEKIAAYNKGWREGIGKEAQASRIQSWRKSNPDKQKSIQLKSVYGITLEQRDEMLLEQGSVCAICKTEKSSARDWHTDHCHASGVVRGILCHHCNTALGLFKDNPATLAAAITYLGK